MTIFLRWSWDRVNGCFGVFDCVYLYQGRSEAKTLRQNSVVANQHNSSNPPLRSTCFRDIAHIQERVSRSRVPLEHTLEPHPLQLRIHQFAGKSCFRQHTVLRNLNGSGSIPARPRDCIVLQQTAKKIDCITAWERPNESQLTRKTPRKHWEYTISNCVHYAFKDVF